MRNGNAQLPKFDPKAFRPPAGPSPPGPPGRGWPKAGRGCRAASDPGAKNDSRAKGRRAASNAPHLNSS